VNHPASAPPRRLLATTLFAALVLPQLPGPALAAPSAAGDPSLEREVPPYAQVVDDDGLLDPATVVALQRISGDTASEVGIQLSVLVVRSLEGVDPQRLAERSYQAWWVGRREADVGLLLLYGAEEGWWQLQWGPALQPLLGDEVVLRPAQRILSDRADRPLGERLVDAAASLARAVGVRERSVANPYEMRRDWARVRTAGWVLGGLLLVVATWVLAILLLGRTGGWVERRIAGRLASQLVLRADGDRLRLHSHPSIWLLLPIALWLVLSWGGQVVRSAGTVARGREVLTCSHASGRCEVAAGREVIGALPLGAVEQLEVSGALAGRADLVAMTRWGRFTLLRGWPTGQVEALARRLETFLAAPEAPPLGEASEGIAWGAWTVLGLAGLAILGALALLWPRRLLVDRRAGWVALAGLPVGWGRPLRSIQAVQVERLVDRQVEALRRRRQPMPYTQNGPLPARILLLVEGGRRLPATAWFPGGLNLQRQGAAEAHRALAQAHLDATARQLAAFLNVPLLEPPALPPPGVVPTSPAP